MRWTWDRNNGADIWFDPRLPVQMIPVEACNVHRFLYCQVMRWRELKRINGSAWRGNGQVTLIQRCLCDGLSDCCDLPVSHAHWGRSGSRSGKSEWVSRCFVLAFFKLKIIALVGLSVIVWVGIVGPLLHPAVWMSPAVKRRGRLSARKNPNKL